jgi:Kef-type K+ transport system membrane component KefB
MTARIAFLLVTLAMVVGPWLIWRIDIVRRIAPLAVLQILAGVLLGPSGLGRVVPAAHAALFPPEVLGWLSGLSTVGVLLYVLVSGLHLDGVGLRSALRRLGPPIIGSIAAPFMLGLGAGWWMLWHVPGALGSRADAPAFVVAIAICIAVTALPVLAAVLREMELITTPLGQTALLIAATNDAALWLMMAVLLALARGSLIAGFATLAAAAVWFSLMLAVVRPGLALIARRFGSDAMLVVVIAAAISSAVIADAIGIGYIIGAFTAGAIVPDAVRASLITRIEPLAASVLLPFFFVVTGLRALIDPASGVFAGILAVTTAATITGKVAGTAIPARLTGTPWRDALALGCRMQTKGLMEVLVLAILADAGVIGHTVFSALVAMAVVCTVISTPATRLALRMCPIVAPANPAS